MQAYKSRDHTHDNFGFTYKIKITEPIYQRSRVWF